MNTQDEIRLRHMLDAAQAALSFAEGRQREDLEEDQQFAFAVVRAVEVIGEAASRIDREVQDTNPEVPWAAVIGMRNRLVHAYFDIDFAQVWSVIVEDLPELIALLESLLPPPAE